MRPYIVLLLVLFTFSSFAKNGDTIMDNDSAKITNLEEFVVEGRTQNVIKHGVEYIPSKKMKNSSVDATQLLINLQAPQLRITPSTKEIKTFTGQDVAFFINYQKASSDDLKGMRTEDVIRVEVLQFPDDPRFLGELNVVNFVIHEYEYGGFTKATFNMQTYEVEAPIGILYSKFNYKNWRFNLSTIDGATRSQKMPYYSEEIFRNINFNGNHFDELSRISDAGEGFFRKANLENVNFRAHWSNNKNITAVHTFRFDRLEGKPVYQRKSLLSYSSPTLPTGQTSYRENLQNTNYSAEGYYIFKLSRSFRIYADWTFGYASNRRDSREIPGNFPEIDNDSREKVYKYEGVVQLTKYFTHNNKLTLNLSTSNSDYKTLYIHPQRDLQKLLSSSSLAYLSYSQNWSNGMSIFTRAGASYQYGRINERREISQINPRLMIQWDYSINQNHSISASGDWSNTSPQSDLFNDAFVQRNELLWLKGTPNLKISTSIQDQITYTYIPTNTLSITTGFSHYLVHNKINAIYSVLPGYDGLVRQAISGGNYNSYTIDLSLNKRLFNALILSAYGSVKWVDMTGSNTLKKVFYTGQISAGYSIGRFYLMGSYLTPYNITDASSLGVITHTKSNYSLSLTYNVGDFLASIQAINIFNDKTNIRTTFTSDNYSQTVREWNEGLGRKIELTLSYTIPYGKKVSRDEEVSKGTPINSAVLK